MKKIFLTTLCILSLVGCSTTKKEDETVDVIETTGDTQIATPFHEVTSLSEATNDAGFSFNIPEEINGNSMCTYLVYDSEMNMLDIRYGTDGNYKAYVRKAEGAIENLSGNYNTFDETKTVTVNDIQVTLSLSEDVCYIAEWNKDGYSYSVDVTDGLSETEMTDLVASIN